MGFSSAHAARAALPAVVLGDLLSDLPEVSNWELRSRMEYRCGGPGPMMHSCFMSYHLDCLPQKDVWELCTASSSEHVAAGLTRTCTSCFEHGSQAQLLPLLVPAVVGCRLARMPICHCTDSNPKRVHGCTFHAGATP